MRARYYSPVMRRFINADILHGTISDSTSLNRYSYVNGNPVSFVDPFGLERGTSPTALEAAYLAQHIYDAKNPEDGEIVEVVGGWKLETIKVNEEGMKIGVYYYVDQFGIKSYALVSAGSTLDIFGDPVDTYYDWIQNNFKQPFGCSQDMIDSIAYANEFVASHPGSHITFVGHSKGGAEAIASAVSTNLDAIVFNPATAFLGMYELPVEDYSGNVTSYVVSGEPLEVLSIILGENIGEKVTIEYPYTQWSHVPKWNDVLLGAQEPTAQLGQQIADYILHFIDKHSMDSVISQIK